MPQAFCVGFFLLPLCRLSVGLCGLFVRASSSLGVFCLPLYSFFFFCSFSTMQLRSSLRFRFWYQHQLRQRGEINLSGFQAVVTSGLCLLQGRWAPKLAQRAGSGSTDRNPQAVWLSVEDRTFALGAMAPALQPSSRHKFKCCNGSHYRLSTC